MYTIVTREAGSNKNAALKEGSWVDYRYTSHWVGKVVELVNSWDVDSFVGMCGPLNGW